MRVQHRVGFTRNGRALRVADGQHLRTLLTRVTQCHQRVHGFTGLRNGHHQRARGENRITITEFVGKLHFHRNTHPMLDGVFGHHARVGGGTAGDDDNLVDRLEIMLVDANLVKIEIASLPRRPNSVRCTAAGPSWISLSMKESQPPFSAAEASQSTV